MAISLGYPIFRQTHMFIFWVSFYVSWVFSFPVLPSSGSKRNSPSTTLDAWPRTRSLGRPCLTLDVRSSTRRLPCPNPWIGQRDLDHMDQFLKVNWMGSLISSIIQSAKIGNLIHCFWASKWGMFHFMIFYGLSDRKQTMISILRQQIHMSNPETLLQEAYAYAIFDLCDLCLVCHGVVDYAVDSHWSREIEEWLRDFINHWQIILTVHGY